MAVLLAAGLAKASDPGAFAHGLAGWVYVPRSWALSLALLVINLEILIAGCWFLGLARGQMLVSGIALVALFSAAYGAHWIVLGSPPECRCFGRLLAIDRMRGEAAIVLGRNASLLALLGSGFALSRRRCSLQCPAPRAGVQRTGARVDEEPLESARGFTLLELVISVAVIGILIATMLPALGHARDRADQVVSLNQMRQHTAVFTAYTADYQGLYPCVTHPRASYSILRNGSFWVRTTYPGAYTYWNIALAPGYFCGRHSDASFNPPRYREKALPPGLEPTLSTYWYSASFIADPLFWQRETRTGPDQWRAVGAHEVSSPSKKVIFFASWPWLGAYDWLNRRNPAPEIDLAFADGSARAVPYGDMLPYYHQAWGSWPQFGVHDFHGFPGMHTLRGVRGRDVP